MRAELKQAQHRRSGWALRTVVVFVPIGGSTRSASSCVPVIGRRGRPSHAKRPACAQALHIPIRRQQNAVEGPPGLRRRAGPVHSPAHSRARRFGALRLHRQPRGDAERQIEGSGLAVEGAARAPHKRPTGRRSVTHTSLRVARRLQPSVRHSRSLSHRLSTST